MRARTLPSIIFIALSAGCASPNHTRPEQTMVVRPFGDVSFVPVIPSLPTGPQLSVLWGDPSTGPSAMLMKFNEGQIPLHYHSSDYHLVVLQGTMKHWGEGHTEADAPPLGPGSYWFQPGNGIHGGSCLTEECMAHMVWLGKRDAKAATVRTP